MQYVLLILLKKIRIKVVSSFKVTIMNTKEKILDILLENQTLKCICEKCANKESHIYQYLSERIDRLVSNNLPIQMILPGFPAKSANRSKTLSDLPDYGEYMALQNLNNLCKKIADIYEPGAKVTICSDGRVFNDLVLVNENDVLMYYKSLADIICKYQFSHLSLFDLSDFLPGFPVNEMREKLVQEYGQSLLTIRKKISTDKNFNLLFNGIHRFLFEDLKESFNELSKNKLRIFAKFRAYSVIQRSNSWSSLIENHFINSIRLSIHPQLCSSYKLGIKLIPGNDKWATPWHNVLVKKNDGSYVLEKNKDAVKKGAKLKIKKGLYYYEL